MKKMVIGVILGAVVLFAWGAVSWMVLPFHMQTLKAMPEEQLITDTMKVVIKDSGFYTFPFCKKDATKEEQAATMAKMKAGPAGIVIFNPDGRDPMSSRIFINGFLIGLIGSIMAMFILAFSRDRIQGLGARVLLLTAVGFTGWALSDLMYWNWFGFPCEFVLANLIDWLVQFALLGLVLHKFVPSYE